MKPFLLITFLLTSLCSFGQETIIMEMPDEDAHYPGGLDSMMHYIARTTIYPTIAIENNDQGKVYIDFIVERDGSITNIKVIRGVTAELDREAVRVIASMPLWKPGKVGDKTCRTRCRIPFVFYLEDDSETKPKKRRFWRRR